MRYVLLIGATLASCLSLVTASASTDATLAPAPVGTLGHTTVVANNTIFIRGGMTRDNKYSKASYAVILDNNKSLKNSNWFDTSSFSSSSRYLAGTVATDNVVITCGTGDKDADITKMSCDMFDTILYKNTVFEPSNVMNRYGMAVAIQKTPSGSKAYFVGGSIQGKNPSAVVDIVNIPTGKSPAIQWSKGTEMTENPRRLHTATWVDFPVNGIVVLGGEASLDTTANSPVSMLDVAVYDTAWSIMRIKLGGSNDTALTLRGHTAVYDGNGNIYVFGGMDSNGAVRNELFILDTKQPRTNWTLQFVSIAPEGRAHHTATVLPDNTMLIMWGINSAGAAQPTYMLYNILSKTWSVLMQFPSMTVIQSPDPEPEVESASQKSDIKIPLVAGLSATVSVFAIIILVYRRRIRPSTHPDVNKGEMGPQTPAIRDKEISNKVFRDQFPYAQERKLYDPNRTSPAQNANLRGPQYGSESSIFLYDEGPRAPQWSKGS